MDDQCTAPRDDDEGDSLPDRDDRRLVTGREEHREQRRGHERDRVLQQCPHDERALGHGIGGALAAARDVHDDDRRRERRDEAERHAAERRRAERDRDERPEDGDEDDLQRDGDEDAARLLRKRAQIELDADLEEQEHDADVSEHLDLVLVRDVPRRERPDDEPHDEISDHGRQSDAPRQDADDAGDEQHEADLEDGDRFGHAAKATR